MKCLGSINFLNTNITMNTTFYNCPLDCFFNWNTIQIIGTQSFNVSRQLYGFIFSVLSDVQPSITSSSHLWITHWSRIHNIRNYYSVDNYNTLKVHHLL